MGSAIQTSPFQALASNIKNADGTTPIYNGGWDFKNASGTSVFTVSSAGAATVGLASPGDVSVSHAIYGMDLSIDNKDSVGAAQSSISHKIGGTTKFQVGVDNNFGTAGYFWYSSAYVGGVTAAGAWTFGQISGSAIVSHKLVGTNNPGGTPVVQIIKNGVAVNTSGNSYLECYASGSAFDGYLGVAGTTLSIIDASDSRKKENIREANFGLAQVNALRPVLFDWKEEFGGEKDIKGFIAQEVEGVLPECITTMDESERGGFADSKFLAATNMIPVLVKAIQELSAQVEELKAEVAVLKAV